ncbi:MAG: HAD-IIB family hydrolase [Verrucomicrobiaceae bacterium]
MSENMERPRMLVVTDLDGTLLNHDDYGFEEVLPVLERLAALKVPVVANTSKTRAEWMAMRGRFANEEAFVVENGSAVILRDGETRVLGERREVIFDFLNEMGGTFDFTGFQELGLEGVMRETGLGEEDARLAGEREFSEPLVWRGTEEEKLRFCEEVKRRGLRTLEGGRFLHVLGRTDKGRALEVLREVYEPESVIVLGDSPNDVAMLERADIGVVIASPKGGRLEVPMGKRLIRSKGEGPEGWAEVMNDLLDELF